MKTTIFSFVLFVLAINVKAQDNGYYRNNNTNSYNAYQTPERVRNGWNRDHPNAETPTWHREGRHWDAEYRDPYTGNTINTYYNRRGKVMDTHTQWEQRYLPQGFDNRIWNRYHTHDYRVTKIDRPRKSSLFQISLNLGGDNRLIYMDEQGNEVHYRDRH